ncbi:DUF6099 family protein [Kitasatospora camelliae]|uniref:DUF6099 family protein n=1 Tax=Kitasatospora camelliae TaxID=3156397 RepID=A0AAU8JTG3_9ACTN
MDALRLIKTARHALAEARTVPDALHEAWQAGLLTEAVGARIADRETGEAGALGQLLCDAGGHAAACLDQPSDDPDDPGGGDGEWAGGGRVERLDELGELEPVLRELGGLLHEVAETLVVLACGADGESLYWRCIDGVDAGAECKELVAELLRTLGQGADGQESFDREHGHPRLADPAAWDADTPGYVPVGDGPAGDGSVGEGPAGEEPGGDVPDGDAWDGVDPDPWPEEEFEGAAALRGEGTPLVVRLGPPGPGEPGPGASGPGRQGPGEPDTGPGPRRAPGGYRPAGEVPVALPCPSVARAAEDCRSASRPARSVLIEASSACICSSSVLGVSGTSSGVPCGATGGSAQGSVMRGPLQLGGLGGAV